MENVFPCNNQPNLVISPEIHQWGYTALPTVLDLCGKVSGCMDRTTHYRGSVEKLPVGSKTDPLLAKVESVTVVAPL